MGTAAFDREEDSGRANGPRPTSTSPPARSGRGCANAGSRFFPVVGWAERGGGNATGHGNSVPRFHLTWGTGPGVLAPFVARVREGEKQGLVTFKFRHRVNELTRVGRAVDGVRGDVLAPSDVERGQQEFARGRRRLRVEGAGGHRHVRRHRRQSRAGAARTGRSVSGRAPERMISRRARPRRRPHAGDHRRRGRHDHQPRPHVALHRRHQELESDLDRSRHPHPARAVVALARRARQAAAGPALSRLRHPRHAQAHHGDRLRLFLVHPDAKDHREGVRAVGLGAESRFHQQELAAGYRPRPEGHSRPGQGVHGQGRGFHRRARSGDGWSSA